MLQRTYGLCIRIGTTLALSLIPPVLRAQSSGANAVTTLPASLGSAISDTGSLALGFHDFTRYRDPVLCVEDARQLRTRLERTLAAQAEADSLLWVPQRDTQPPVVAQIARQCAARFSVATTPAKALHDLFDLALLAEDDSLATRVVARQIALATTPEERVQIWMTAFMQYIGEPPAERDPDQADQHYLDAARPARLGLATVVLAQLDGLGHSALSSRLEARRMLLRFWMRSRDLKQVQAVATQLLALGDAPTAWSAHVRIALVTHPESVLVLGQRARMAITRTTPPSPPSDTALSDVRWIQQKLLRYGMSDDGLQLLMSGNASVPMSDTPFHLRADYWFPAHGNTGGDTIVPAPGYVNLLIVAGHPAVTAWIQRWLARYSAQGLRVTVVATTRGYIWGTPGWDVSRVISPPQEADSLRWKVQDFEQLPVTVAVIKYPVQRYPPPDGRHDVDHERATVRQMGEVQKSIVDNGNRPGSLILTDQTGHVLYQRRDVGNDLNAAFELPELDALITAVFARSTAVPKAGN